MKTPIRKLISTLCLLTTLAAQTASGFYDPNLQRWLTPDPIGEAGGINLYAFNNNAPVNWVDPDGAIPTLLTGGIGFVAGGVIGGGAAWWRGGNIWEGATKGAVVGGLAGFSGGLAGGTAARFLAGRGINAVAVGVGSGAVGGLTGDVAAQAAEMVMGDRCRFNGVRTVTFGAVGGVLGGGVAAWNAAKTVANRVPSTMARVIPEGIPATTLGPPRSADVFVTAAEDIAGMNASQIANRLTLRASPTGFRVFEFPTPQSGVASPVFRTDPGFMGGGRTAGGAREFVIPNQPIPPGATIRILP